MPRRLTNLLLLALVAALIASGVLGWVLPKVQALPLYGLHRLLGVVLLALLVWKYGIVRRSLGRRLRWRRWDRSVLIGGAAGLVLAGALGLGLSWTLGLVSFRALAGYSPLNVHVFLGLFFLPPLVIWHALRRGEKRPPLGALVSRRSALRLLGVSAAALVSWQALERALEAFASGDRQASGSKHAGSFTGNAFPVTNWFLDRTPELDENTWRLAVTGPAVVGRSFTYPELRALPPAAVRAVLDCTSGWWSAQDWWGVRVGDVLAASGTMASARAVEVRSVTGHRWTFPIDEVRGALLATHVGGEPLSPGHGYPVRLVVPERRGFQWVKWVTAIDVF